MPETQIGPASRATRPEQRLLTRSAQVAQAKTGKISAPQPSPAFKGKSTRALLITDATDKKLSEIASAYAKQVLGLEAKDLSEGVTRVDTWQALAAVLKGYGSIDHLVLMFHGTPGSLLVGAHHKSLAEVAPIFSGRLPRIEVIDLEGCSIGEGAAKLIPFARLFGASRITAFNYFWVTQRISVEVRSSDVKALENELARFKGYFLPGTPMLTELVTKRAKYTLWAEWFRDEFDETALPSVQPGEIDPRRKEFKPRSASIQRYVDAAGAAKLEEEYGSSPLRRFERVIVQLMGGQ